MQTSSAALHIAVTKESVNKHRRRSPRPLVSPVCVVVVGHFGTFSKIKQQLDNSSAGLIP